MQTVSSNFLASAQGSNTPVFTADLWKDGVLVTALPLETGSVNFDSTQNVQGSMSIVVADADGTLTPTSMGSPLSPFGGQVNIKAGFKIGTTVETVSLGWFAINQVDIEEAWTSMTDSVTGITQLVRKGSRMTVTGADLMEKIADYKFLVPTAPTEATAWAEIVTLVQGVVPTAQPTYTGFQDVSLVNTNLTYGEDRLEALKALAALMNAEPVMSPAGNLTLRPLNPAQDSTNTAPTFGWTINLTEYKKSLSRDGVFNCVVAKGKDSSSNSLIAYSILKDGPASFYGSMGPRPVFYSSDFLTTPAAVQAWADSLLATKTTQSTQVVPVKALPNPAIELGDYVSLSIQGSSTPVTCRIIGFSFPDTGEMSVNLSMPQNWIG